MPPKVPASSSIICQNQPSLTFVVCDSVLCRIAMDPSSPNDHVLQRELERVSVEARAFEGAFQKMKADRDRLLNELEDASKQIR